MDFEKIIGLILENSFAPFDELTINKIPNKMKLYSEELPIFGTPYSRISQKITDPAIII